MDRSVNPQRERLFLSMGMLRTTGHSQHSYNMWGGGRRVVWIWNSFQLPQMNPVDCTRSFLKLPKEKGEDERRSWSFRKCDHKADCRWTGEGFHEHRQTRSFKNCFLSPIIWGLKRISQGVCYCKSIDFRVLETLLIFQRKIVAKSFLSELELIPTNPPDEQTDS